MLYSGMFSHHSLFSNKFTEDGERALRAAAGERNSNPDFVELKLMFTLFDVILHSREMH